MAQHLVRSTMKSIARIRRQAFPAAQASTSLFPKQCVDGNPNCTRFLETSPDTFAFQNIPSSCHPQPSLKSGFVSYERSRSFSTKSTTKARKMIPRKAALNLTPKAREIFKKLISSTGSEGIMLKYEISSGHALRMAFKFDLIKDASKELTKEDEGVSLEVLEDGVTPKPPSESWDDNLPKLYIHHGAFMKVLGGTLDVDLDASTGTLTPKLLDRNGHEMDPNA